MVSKLTMCLRRINTQDNLRNLTMILSRKKMQCISHSCSFHYSVFSHFLPGKLLRIFETKTKRRLLG